ncbi:MFS transporter [Micrococcus lylae]|uniref:MFS transporter n=1 Tax=Micrococcus lylae TaxID=1273 RepID=UPI003EBC8038
MAHDLARRTAGVSGRAGLSTRAWVFIVLAGIAAAMHVWKLPGVLVQVRDELGMSLVASGVLLGIVQVAAMLAALAVSLFSEVLGLRRTLVAGIGFLALGSLVGAASTEVWHLMATRAVEGIGFLRVTVTAPPLIRRCTPARLVSTAVGGWSAFQGTALLLALTVSTLLATGAFTGGDGMSWRTWWIIMGVLTLATVPGVLLQVPADPRDQAVDVRAGLRRINATVRTARPWLLGVVFGCYTVQWGAVLMFLPTMLAASGVDPVTAGVATAVAGGCNAVGAVVTGLLLRRGAPVRPLVATGLVTMAVTTVAIYSVDWTQVPGGALWVLLAAALFSGIGGTIPSALTCVAVDAAPPGGSGAAVIGVLTQVFNLFNFLGPVLLAAITDAAGGWHLSWTMTVGTSVLGLLIAWPVLSPRRTPALER